MNDDHAISGEEAPRLDGEVDDDLGLKVSENEPYSWGQVRECSPGKGASLLSEKLSRLPDSPGVYLHKDKAGRILYVGKAQNLKNRVRSYFQVGAKLSPRIAWMVSKVDDIELFLVGSELEALILECTLIKRYRPYFNVRYRDDKRYPLLEITTSEAFPAIRVVRKATNKKNRYFGPYPDAGAMRRTLKLIQKLFKIRTCKIDMTKIHARPCLDYHIDLCTAPCTRYVDEAAYRLQVDAAIDFLEGRSDRVIAELQHEMQASSERLDFERCARLRDTLNDIARVVEKQSVVSLQEGLNEDYIAVATHRDVVVAHVLIVRGGKLIEQKSFFLDSHAGGEDRELISGFLKEYYGHPVTLPHRVVVSAWPDDGEVLERWLSELAQHRVELRAPQRGSKRRLLDLALKNAEQALKLESVGPTRYESRRQGLAEIQESLGLDEPPWRIECVDISNTQGRQAVGSMVVFEQGMPKVAEYRRFRITSGDTPDDFRMMHEVLSRRFRDRGQGGNYESLPDLLIVDGGKGQLSAAVRALKEMGVDDRVPVFGLAKKHEWLFAPGSAEPIVWEPQSKALAIITHLRDEAHRFAITYHRKLRSKATRASVLDEAPGVGPARKLKLLKHFGTLKRLMAASLDEIKVVPGVGNATAEALHAYLHGGRHSSKGRGSSSRDG